MLYVGVKSNTHALPETTTSTGEGGKVDAVGRVIAGNTPTRQPVHSSGSAGDGGCAHTTYGRNVVPSSGPGSSGHGVDVAREGFNYFRSVSPSCRLVLGGSAAAGTRAYTATAHELSVGAGGSGGDAKAARPIDHLPPLVSRDPPPPSHKSTETPPPPDDQVVAVLSGCSVQPVSTF